MRVFVFPPKESCRSLVNLESLYGICPPFFPSTKEFITFPSAVKDKLILAPYFNLSPVASVLDCLSEPAKSTRFIFEALTLSAPSNDYTWTVKIA